jgi:filamentous hemagglutinin family protein
MAPPALCRISLAVCLLAAPPLGFALPQGATAVSGQTSVRQTTPGQLDIVQGSARAIIDWTSFSIAAGERVNIAQPGSTSVLLNRVLGDNPSLIYGALSSNGSVWLINPRGIVFGASSQVDVGGLVASTLALAGDPFAPGRLQFSAGAGAAGELRSEGRISAADGSVVLVAPQLLQAGSITARRVGLAAASEVLVDVEGDGLIFFNARNDRLESRLSVLGSVRADGGSAELRAAARTGFADTVLNLEGVVQARSIGVREGRIVIDGGAYGGTRVAGRLDAGSGSGVGGQVLVQGERVLIDSGAVIDASGATAGGGIRIGGDLQGRNPELRNATTVSVQNGAVLRADAGLRGDGGRIIVWSDDTTLFNGLASARGGALGGNGGFVETSGRRQLGIATGRVDVSAPAGRGGRWLLDPEDIVVADAGSAAYPDLSDPALPADASFTIQPATLNAVGGDVVLAASRDIKVQDALTLTTPGAGLSLQAGRDIGITAAVTTNNGAVTLQAGNRIDINAAVSSGNGAIALTTGSAGLGLAAAARLDAGSGNISLNGGGGDVLLLGALATSSTDAAAIRITNVAGLSLGNVATGGAAGQITLSFSGTGGQGDGSSIQAGRLVKQGSGTLVLSQANAYDGGTLVSGGTLRIAGSTAGAGTGAIDIGSNTLDIASGARVNAALAVADGGSVTSSSGGGTLGAGSLNLAGGATLNLASSGGTLTVERVVPASGGPTPESLRIGGGSVVLAADNAYAGGTTVDANALLVLGAGGATGNAGAGAITLGSGATLRIDRSGSLALTQNIAGASAGDGRLEQVGSGTTVLGGANSYGSTVVSGGVLQVGDGGSTGTLGQGGVSVAAPGRLRVQRSDTFTLDAALSGDGGLEQQGSGTTVLTAANAGYSGAITVGAGTLRVSGGAAGAGTGALAIGANTLDIAGGAALGNDISVANGGRIVSSAGGGTLAAGGALTLGNGVVLGLAGATGSPLTVARAIVDASGNGGIDVTAGTVALTAANSYGGSTRVDVSATLAVGAGGASGTLGSGAVVNDGVLRIDRDASSTLTLDAPISGVGSLQLAGGGTTVIRASGTYTGGTTVDHGTLRVSGTAARAGLGLIALGSNTLDIAAGASVANDLSLAAGAALTNSAGAGTLAASASALSLAEGSTLTVSSAGTGLTIARSIGDGPGSAALALTSGKLTLTAANAYDGGTTVGASATLKLTQSAAAGTGAVTLSAATSTLDLADGAILPNGLIVGASNALLTNSSGAGSLGAGSLVLADGVNLRLSSSATGLSIDRRIDDGAGSARITAAGGLVTLNAANSYDGGTTVDAGTLRLAGAAASAGSGAITLGAGATLDISGGAVVNQALSVAGGATVRSSSGNGTLAAGPALSLGDGVALNLAGGSSSTLTVARSITDTAGNGALGVSGGTVVLTAANSHGGTTSIANGATLVLGIGGAGGSLGAGPVLDNGVLRIDRDSSAVLTLAGAITGSGSLEQAGPGTTVLTADNSHGSTRVAAGVLQVGNGGANGSLGGGAVVVDAPGALRLVRSGSVTVAGAISGSGGLEVAGSGTVVLTGQGSYSGGTTITSGTLKVSGASAAAGSGAIALGANTLDISDGATVANALTLDSGATLANSSGNGTLAAHPSALALALAGGSMLNLRSDGAGLSVQRVIGSAAGSATVAVAGAATVTLAAANAYAGSTRVDGGTLALGRDGALPAGTALVVAGGTLALGTHGASVASAQLLGGAITGSSGVLVSGSDFDLRAGSVSAILGGSAGLAKTGAGTVSLSGANTYAGATSLSAGSLLLAADQTLPAGTALGINGGTLDLGSSTGSVASLTLTAGTLAGSGTLTAGSYSLLGGTVDGNLGAGTLDIGGPVNLNGRSAAAVVNLIAGRLTLGAADRLADDAAVNVSAGATLALGGAETVGTLALAGNLAGSGSLAATTYGLTGGSTAAGANLGSGVLVSNGSSTLGGSSGAGQVTVNSGSLRLGASGRLADAAAVSVASGAGLLLGGSETVASLALAGQLAGSGTLNAATTTLAGGRTVAGADLGAGTLTSSGASALGGRSAAGRVDVASGSLTLGADDRLAGTAVVTVASGATLALGGNNTVAQLALDGNLAGAGTLTAAAVTLGMGSTTAAGANLGTGRLNVAGDSSLGGSSAAGVVSIDAGSLRLGSAERLADTAAVSVATGATLLLGGSETVGTLQLAGRLDGAATLTAGSYRLDGGTVNAALGGGALVSNGNSLLAGTAGAGSVAVDSGTLALASGGRLAAGAVVSVAGGATLRLGGAENVASLALAGTLAGSGQTLATADRSTLLDGARVDANLGGALLEVTGNALLVGSAASTSVKVLAGTLSLASGGRLSAGAAVQVAGGAELALGGNEGVRSLSLAGRLSGDALLSAQQTTLLGGATVLARLGGGRLDVEGDALLAGSSGAQVVSLNAGTLTLGSADRLADDAAVTVNAPATLTLNGNDTVGSLTVLGTVNGTGRLTAGAYTLVDANYALDLGAGNLVSRGQSRLGGSSAAAQVSVESGTLTLGSAGRFTAAPAVAVASGATLALGGDESFGALAGAGSVALGAATLSTGSGGSSVFSGALSGSGGLTKTGASSFTLAGDSGYTGSTRVQAGELVVAGTLASAAVQVDAGTLTLTRPERLADGSAVAVAAGANLNLAGAETVGRLDLAGTLGGSGRLSAASYRLDGGNVLADLGGGTLVSAGNSTLRGSAAAARVVVDSGSLSLAGANRLADDAEVTVRPGAVLVLGGNDTVGRLGLAGTLAGSGTLSAGNVLLDGGSASASLVAGALVSRGSSVLAGTATAATVAVETGTLVLASAQRLLALPAVQVAGGAALVFAGDQVFGLLGGAGSVALAGFTLSTGAGGDSVFAGAISGSGSLVKQGASSFTLSGSNTYSGVTRVQAGTLRLGDGGSSGSLADGAIVVDGRLALARSDDTVLAQAVSGSGSVEQAGSGRVLFSGSNKSYGGDTVVTRGELATANAEALPDASAVVVAAAGRLTLGGSETLRSLTADGAVALTGSLVASGDLLLRGAVSSAGAVSLSGQRIEATNDGNRFGGSVSLAARGPLALAAGREGSTPRDLTLGAVSTAAGGRIDAGVLTLGGAVAADGGRLELVAAAAPPALAPDAELAGKQVASLPLAFAGDAVLQGEGSRISVASGAELAVTASRGGSIQLLGAGNSFVGGVSVQSVNADTAWSPKVSALDFGAGAANYAVQSRIRLNGTTINVGSGGIVADLVSIRADRLATPGATGVIVARLPFDRTAGRLSSLPALTLELTPASYLLSFPFGAPGVDGGLRVNVGSRAWGDRTLPLDAGYVAVLPRSGAPGGTVVLLAGPAVNPNGGYRFYFDGSGSQSQIPVFYNGVLPTTPQVESSISATASISEGARKERFDESVRTENVAVRLRAGVIAEVGPAAASTQGTEGLRLPTVCPPQAGLLLCEAPPK